MADVLWRLLTNQLRLQCVQQLTGPAPPVPPVVRTVEKGPLLGKHHPCAVPIRLEFDRHQRDRNETFVKREVVGEDNSFVRNDIVIVRVEDVDWTTRRSTAAALPAPDTEILL